jgi:chromosome segregation ATPase
MQRKEQKLEEVYEQLSIVERDRARIREQMIRFEEENRTMMGQIEEQKIEMAECKKHIEIYEEKIA